LGYREAFEEAIAALSRAAVAVVLDDDMAGVPAEALAAPGHLLYLGTRLPEAARVARIVLPTTNLAEEDGTFVNRDRRVQRYFQAKPAPGMARPAWWILGELLAALERGGPFLSASEAFDLLAREEPAFSGLSYDRLGTLGAVLPEARPAGVGA